MNKNLMILPATNFDAIKLLRIPEDWEEHEAYRYVTGVIASIEEDNPDYTWDDIEYAFEEKGFESMEFILGPVVDEHS